MRLGWKKHRMRCVNARCAKRFFVLRDHRIAAKNCLLTTRAAKGATEQVGTGRTVKEVAGELACDWHTVNDAVTTYGKALLEADRKQLNQTTAIGLDETSFVRLSSRHTDYVTTVADVENHQIIEIPPTRIYTDVAGWIDRQPQAWKERIAFGALDMSNTYAAVYSVMLPKPDQVVDPFHLISLANRSTPSAGGSRSNSWATGVGATIRPIGPGVSYSWVKRSSRSKPQSAWPRSSSWAIPAPRKPLPTRVKERLRDFYRTVDPDAAKAMLTELQAA